MSFEMIIDITGTTGGQCLGVLPEYCISKNYILPHNFIAIKVPALLFFSENINQFWLTQLLNHEDINEGFD